MPTDAATNSRRRPPAPLIRLTDGTFVRADCIVSVRAIDATPGYAGRTHPPCVVVDYETGGDITGQAWANSIVLDADSYESAVAHAGQIGEAVGIAISNAREDAAR